MSTSTPTIQPYVFTLICAAAIVVGSLMPWATITGIVSGSIAGTEGDGVVTLVLGLTLGIIAITQQGRDTWGTTMTVFALVTGAISGTVAAAAMIGLDRVADVQYATVTAGPGLYLVMLASLGAIVSVLLVGRTRTTTPTESGR